MMTWFAMSLGFTSAMASEGVPLSSDPPATAATVPPVPVVSPGVQKLDRGGRIGVGVELINPAPLTLDVSVRTGRLGARAAVGWTPYTLTDTTGSVVEFNAGDLTLNLAPRVYLNASQKHIYQHAIELLGDYVAISLDPGHPPLKQVGVALNYVGEVYVSPRAALVFGGGPGVLFGGKQYPVNQRFESCASHTIACSASNAAVFWLDVSLGFRIYFP